MDIVLDAVEARVLGSLLEKERTVPATYPLTLNAVISACNQSSSRDPLMAVGEAEVEAAIEALKGHKLVRRILPSHGHRTVKYRQVADEALALDPAQRAVLTVLLLRGPQTPQELKTRTDRLHPFADAGAVTATLEEMAGWGDPLVRLLPRRSGQRDARWAHLLSGEPSDEAPTPAPPRAPAPAGDPALHGEVLGLLGRWRSDAGEVELAPVPGRAVVAYRSTEPLEAGFLRLRGDGEVRLAVAGADGTAWAEDGLVEDGEVVAGPRTLRLDGDTLLVDGRPHRRT
jgi:uncharacterized protein YceH (UPF0502 family)